MKRILPVFGLFLASCGGGRTVPTVPSDLQSTTWRLQTLQRAGASAVTVEKPDQYTLRLDASGQASVRADCNSCGGRYAMDGAKLSVAPLACTLLACSPGSLDSDYLSLLGGETQASSDAGQLVLTSSRGILRYSR